jgi:tetratricopeptide (TPR) repeat protein
MILAKSLAYLGIELDHNREGAEAEASLREAIGLFEGLVTQAPKVPQYREEQACCKNALGELMRDLGRNAEAETMFREVTVSFERLVADAPNNPHYGAELAVAEGDLADALADRGEFAAALDQLKRAAPRIDAALKANPDRADYHGMLRTIRQIQARCRASLGEPSAALEIAESIGRLGLDNAADNYASAAALARCMPAAGRDDPMHFADRAMDALRRAVAAGFRDVVALRTSVNLDRLRDRDDFHLLTMDLAFPAEPFARGR